MVYEVNRTQLRLKVTLENIFENSNSCVIALTKNINKQGLIVLFLEETTSLIFFFLPSYIMIYLFG